MCRNFILGIFLILSVTACDPSPRIPKANNSVGIPVLVTEPVIKDVPLYIESIGIVLPWQYFEIRPQVGGVLQEIHVKEGQLVNKDDILFAIDPKVYNIKLREAQAQLAMDKAAHMAAKRKLDRLKPLAEKDLISQVEWDAIEAEALASLALIELNEARIASINLDLESCMIKAPDTGKIGKIDTFPGAIVTASQSVALASISQMDSLIVEFTVTEKEFSELQKESSVVSIRQLCGSSDEEIEGKISFFDNQFDSMSGRLTIRAEVLNATKCLHPGQTVRVRIVTEVIPSKLLIPQKSVKYDSEGPYAYVVDEHNVAVFRQLTLGDEIDDDVIVAEGIVPHEKVITAGHLRLSPGLKVEIK